MVDHHPALLPISPGLLEWLPWTSSFSTVTLSSLTFVFVFVKPKIT
jgi:hypothetical protein